MWMSGKEHTELDHELLPLLWVIWVGIISADDCLGKSVD